MKKICMKFAAVTLLLAMCSVPVMAAPTVIAPVHVNETYCSTPAKQSSLWMQR